MIAVQRLSVLLALSGVVAACGEAPSSAATDEPSDSAPAGATAAAFSPQADVAPGVQAFPRLAGEGAAVIAINGDLARFDAQAAESQCEAGEYTRHVRQPMTGPAYVTFASVENWSCEGAAHPSVQETAISYDLSTGERLDWPAALPGLQLAQTDAAGMSASYVPTVRSQALSEWYSQTVEAPEGCEEVLTAERVGEYGMRLWLDAERNGVMAQPDFPHVVQACAEPALMDAEALGRFGAPEALIDAVGQAHAAGNWGPREP